MNPKSAPTDGKQVVVDERYIVCPNDGEPLEKTPGLITIAECPDCNYTVAQTYTNERLDEALGKSLKQVRDHR